MSLFDLRDLPEHLKKEFDQLENEKCLKSLLRRCTGQLKVSSQWNQLVGWKCNKCGGKWSASPSNRTDIHKHTHSQCPYCPTKESDTAVNCNPSSSCVKKESQSQVGTENELLQIAFPSIAAQWDFLRNGNHLNKISVDVSNIKITSSVCVWWKCPQCRKSWKAAVSSRVLLIQTHSSTLSSGNPLLCPQCMDNGRVSVHHRRSAVLSDHPQLLNEAILPVNENPNCISLYSDRILNWRCSYCLYEYQTTIANRYLRNERCPQCSGKAKSLLNLLVCQRPDVVKEISFKVPQTILKTLSLTDDRKLPFVCKKCHGVYYMSVKTRCLIPKGELACPKCFFRSSLVINSKGCLERVPQSKKEAKRRIQVHQIETRKMAVYNRCGDSISLAKHILQQNDRSLNN